MNLNTLKFFAFQYYNKGVKPTGFTPFQSSPYNTKTNTEKTTLIKVFMSLAF